MEKILVSDKLAPEGVDILKESGFDVDYKPGLDKEELKKIIGNYEAIVVRSQTKLTADVIEKADKLKIIGRAGVGLDNVDIPAATKKGIIVMNAPGGNTVSTCEHTFALMLALARKIPFAYISLKEKKEWKRSRFKGVELYSKTLGIIGLGRIGKAVAQRALAFNMDIIAYDPFITKEIADKIGVKMVSLDELLKQADFVTLHIPLNAETKGLISSRQLAMMKSSAFLINCARGGIIDEDALYDALSGGAIAGAALDVFSTEPPLDSKLLGLDNIIVTPHLGASTEEAQVNVAVEIANCIKDAFRGRAIRNAVNYVQMEPDVYKAVYPYIELAEKMGKFVSQLIEGGTQSIDIAYIGEIASFKVDPLGMAFTKGFLSTILEENVNFINSMEIARERGIKIEQTKISREEEYVNSIRVKVKTDTEERTLEGTLFSNKEPRFVKIDDVYIEIAPSPFMLVINNWDKPGVIGSIGTVLGSHKVNIANLSLGRKDPEGVAITVLNVDSPVDEKVIKDIKKNPNIISLKLIRL